MRRYIRTITAKTVLYDGLSVIFEVALMHDADRIGVNGGPMLAQMSGEPGNGSLYQSPCQGMSNSLWGGSPRRPRMALQ